MPKIPDKIKVNEIPVRDEPLKRLILGRTKSGPHRNKKKEGAKNAARKKVTPEAE